MQAIQALGNWLKDWEAAIQAVSALAVVALTIFLGIENWRYRRAMILPCVSAMVDRCGKPIAVRLLLRNDGLGPARTVEVGFRPDPMVKKSGKMVRASTQVFPDGIEELGVGQTRWDWIPSSLLGRDAAPTCKVVLSYTWGPGRRARRACRLDLRRMQECIRKEERLQATE